MSVNPEVQYPSIAVKPLFEGGRLPLLVTPAGNASLKHCLNDIQRLVSKELYLSGGLLLRGFELDAEMQFNHFCQSFGDDLLNYDYASTPRSQVNKGVYTSTEYPAHQSIPLHNEQAYTTSWPMKIWFNCVTASAEGGETPIADSRRVYQELDADIKEKFTKHGLLYVRNYGNGLDLPWQKAFNTQSKADVEAFCKSNQINYVWKEDGELQTRQVCQAVAQHPFTRDMVWFNQAHLFHVSNLDPAIRETLLSIVGEQDLPRNVYYGNGEVIADHELEHIRQVLKRCQVSFPWQVGDIMMLDNMLSAHARSPFKGERKVIVAMAEPHN
ncbi:TauD/TfdA family dioxygenase [Thalassomonas haliotis]|uniref:TauD/TfdA family dioxygenase n=1 Tax=Thalassomonas haliotis TaxID=485448 RepID=A0ABY7VH87_9GAMM|nr:TauD/TfdA family dioxygenase [Thalassomonas haliotis]WDE12579.1 TauD/TfdA family dioxygenase [Thalassomonas haliotis]